MKSFLTFAFFFSFIVLYAQNSEKHLRKIDRYADRIDNSQLQLDSINSIFDSITVKTSIYKDKLFSISHFENSNTDLAIIYYFKDKNLILVKVVEQSPGFKDLNKYSSFYISDDKIISEKYCHNIRTGIIPFDRDIYELYGYNKAFNRDFLELYIFNLLDKIKTTANK